MPSRSGSTLSLCRLDEEFGILFIPLFTYAEAYVMAENRCETDQYLSMKEGGFAQMQSMGIVPADLPENPTVGLQGYGRNSIFVVVLLAFFGFSWMSNKRPARAKPQPKLSNPSGGQEAGKVASPMDALMTLLGSAVVNAGAADVQRVELLEAICSKVQGAKVGMSGALSIVSRAKCDLSETEITGLGRLLNGDQREMVFSAAALLSTENGSLVPQADDFIERLRRGLSISQSAAHRMLAEAA
ncbi:MAG: hypothetical protein WBB85_08665 [Albidovulum sp.]|uniref:hypothetical protein n=1 Tax=Albidovulum sp. TaxID=1872424 RepID=UPI003C8B4C03